MDTKSVVTWTCSSTSLLLFLSHFFLFFSISLSTSAVASHQYHLAFLSWSHPRLQSGTGKEQRAAERRTRIGCAFCALPNNAHNAYTSPCMSCICRASFCEALLTGRPWQFLPLSIQPVALVSVMVCVGESSTVCRAAPSAMERAFRPASVPQD